MKKLFYFIFMLILIYCGIRCTSKDKVNSGHKKTGSEVLVINDFENKGCLNDWQGTASVSEEFSSHGNSGVKLISDDGRSAWLQTEKMPEDWSNFEYLKFDIFNPSDHLAYGSLRIFDKEGTDEEADFQGQSYNGDGKLFMNKGWNHFSFLIHEAMVEEGNRHVNPGQIRKMRFSFRPDDIPVFIDNIRLVRGDESRNSRSEENPHDCSILIKNRDVYPVLTGPPDMIKPGKGIIRLREKAEKAVANLENGIKAAELQGFQTLYQRIPLITAEVGMGVRSKLVWFQNEKSEEDILNYIISSCDRTSVEISEMLSAGRNRLLPVEPENDVSNNSLYVPSYPPLNELHISDGAYCDKAGRPVIIFSMLQLNEGPLMDYFAPFNHRIESYTVGGGSRYNIESSPVYEAFHKYQGTHRVGWDGWCGHLIKDRWAMGGKKEDVVICLESPEIRKAIQEYIKLHYNEWITNPNLLYNIMAYELQYICYCAKSQEMFQDWLRSEYGSLNKLNMTWQTRFTQFSEIRAPETKNAGPVDGVNRAAWYDWATFNSRRFTDYLMWIKSEMRKYDQKTPVCAGGTSSMLSSSNSVTGIDEELIINEIDDVILNESGESPIFSDLLLSLSRNKKVMVDPEMGGGTHGLLLQFLHGKSDISKWWWAGSPSTEYMRMNQSSLPHSSEISLKEIDEVLKISLDVRRLSSEISEFTKKDPEIAIFYSKTSIIQVPPGQVQAGTTPYTDALRSVWEGSRFLGCRIGFISEKQISEGRLSGIRLLIVPAVKYIKPEVAFIIKKYIENGGTAVIIPESFMFDQYARENNMLKEMGINITGVTLPEVKGEAERIQNYDQSFSKQILYGNVMRRISGSEGDMFAGDTLASEGLVQALVPGKSKILAGFNDGSPAIILASPGKGSLYYLAAPVRAGDYHSIFTKIAEKHGLNRPLIAVGKNGKPVTGAEVRAVERDNDYLLYASNLTGETIEFEIKGKEFMVPFLDIRSLESHNNSHISLKPYQETIFKMDKKQITLFNTHQ